jgi:hypothetical protein
MLRNLKFSLAVGAMAVLALAMIPTEARASRACSDEGLAFYPLASPLTLLDTATGVAHYPQAYPLQHQQQFQARVGGVAPGARALVARVTLSGYRGEWDDDVCAPTTSGSPGVCVPPGFEPTDSARYPRLRLSSALNAPSNGAGVVRVGSGPAMPTEQIVTFPLASDGTVVLRAESIFDTRIEVVGYYAPPGPGALYLHLLPKPAYLFSAYGFTSGAVNTLGRSMFPGESFDIEVVGTRSNGPPWYNDPSTYSIPGNARYVLGNTLAYLQWGFSTPATLQSVLTYETGAALPRTGISLTTWDGFAEGAQYLVPVSEDGYVSIYSSARTDIYMMVSGYYSPQRGDDGNGPGLLFHPRPHAVKGSSTLEVDDYAGPFYVPAYDGDASACGVAAAGRLRFLGTGDGNGQEFSIAEPAPDWRGISGIATAADTNDEVGFVTKFGPNGGFNLALDTADRPGEVVYFEIDTYGLFAP